jgi:phosphatidylglycerophosphatase C
MKICAFDFDGTLIKKDSIKLFCKWVCVNKIEFFLIYHLYFRILTIFNNKNLKFKRVNYFYNLMIRRKLDINFFTKKLLNEEFLDSPKLISDMKKIYHVIIISASFDFILQGYSEHYNIPVFANSLNNLIDLNYQNKVEVIKLNYTRDDILEIAYGNSEGDFEMLNHSNTPYFRTNNGEIIKWQI